MKLISTTSEAVYKNIKTEYQNADKIVKKSAKQDKRKYIESMAYEAAAQLNMVIIILCTRSQISYLEHIRLKTYQ